VEGGTPRTASAWVTSTTSSSSNPVVLALASSAATIPMTALLTRIPRAVLLSFLETISTATLISERQDLLWSQFLHRFSFTGHYLIHVTYHGSDRCAYERLIYSILYYHSGYMESWIWVSYRVRCDHQRVAERPLEGPIHCLSEYYILASISSSGCISGTRLIGDSSRHCHK